MLALPGILGGLMIEGGKIRDIVQFTAAMIVLGGTARRGDGVHPAQCPKRRASGGWRACSWTPRRTCAIIEEVIGYATKARKNGLVSLEQEAEGSRIRFSARP